MFRSRVRAFEDMHQPHEAVGRRVTEVAMQRFVGGSVEVERLRQKTPPS